MSSLALALAVLWATHLTGCGSPEVAPTSPLLGDSDFSSAPPDQGGWGYGLQEDADFQDPSRWGLGLGTPSTASRVIRTADLIQTEGSILYVFNAHAGLFVIDQQEPEAPTFLGHLDVYGEPVALHVHGQQAHLVVSRAFRVSAEDGTAHAELGSTVLAVDLTDPTQPQVQHRLSLPGHVTDVLRVGELLYAISHHPAWLAHYDVAQGAVDTVQVVSIDLTAPEGPVELDRMEVPQDGVYENQVHLTDQTLWVASTRPAGSGYETTVRTVDLDHEQGTLTTGAELVVEGVVQERWQLHEHDGVLHVVTPRRWWSGEAPRIHTYRRISPTQLSKLAELTLDLDHPDALSTVHFAGERAYVVTDDPVGQLVSVDLSDPTRPVQVQTLDTGGRVAQLVAQDDRLITLAQAETDLQGIADEKHLTLSLFDVSSTRSATRLASLSLGAVSLRQNGETGLYDEVLHVLPDEALGLLPFTRCSPGESGPCPDAVQLVDLSGDELTLRGVTPQVGALRRALMVGERLVTVSDEQLQIVDIGDRDTPVVRAGLALSANVTQVAAVGEHLVQLVGDWTRGGRLVVTPRLSTGQAPQPRAAPVAELELRAPYARLFAHGNHVFVLHRDPDSWQRLLLTPVDLSDPAVPRRRPSLPLPEGLFQYWGAYDGWWKEGTWGYPRSDEVVQLHGTTLVLHAVSHWAWCNDCAPDRLVVVDLSVGDVPVIAAGDDADPLELPGRDWVGGLRVFDDRVYFTHYELAPQPDARGRAWVRYFLNAVDLSDPYHPVIAPGVNVPGVLLGADHSRGLIYTVDYQYDGDYRALVRSLNVLSLGAHRAVLRGRVNLPDSAGPPVVSGSRAWWVRNQWRYDGGLDQHHAAASLQSVDLSNPLEPILSTETPLSVPTAALYDVRRGRAILGTWWHVTGLLAFDALDNGTATFTQHVRTKGWVSHLLETDDALYVATGPQGVHKLD